MYGVPYATHMLQRRRKIWNDRDNPHHTPSSSRSQEMEVKMMEACCLAIPDQAKAVWQRVLKPTDQPDLLKIKISESSLAMAGGHLSSTPLPVLAQSCVRSPCCV